MGQGRKDAVKKWEKYAAWKVRDAAEQQDAVGQGGKDAAEQSGEDDAGQVKYAVGQDEMKMRDKEEQIRMKKR